MWIENNKIIINYENNLKEKLRTLKKVYNIKTNSKLIAHIVDLELKKQKIDFD